MRRKDDAYLTVNQSDKRKVLELHKKFSKYMTYTVNRPNIKKNVMERNKTGYVWWYLENVLHNNV